MVEPNRNNDVEGNNTTVENPITNDEPMDWCSIDEQETIANLQALRRSVTERNELTHFPQTEFQEIVDRTAPEMCQNMTILKDIYVVVDTNIFISHLSIIKQVLEIKINGVEIPKVLIPWMVIQELDYIKDGRSGDKLKSKAQEAIRYINGKLSRKNPYVKGQSVIDAAAQDFSSTNPDDGILHCCLQIVKKGNKAILLSNDVNLRNKTMLHHIPAYSHKTILNALNPNQARDDESCVQNVVKENDKIGDFKFHLSKLCNHVISECLKEAYGEVWNQLKLNPPWTLQECIGLFQRYWRPVFTMHLNKQCEKLFDDFECLFKANPDGIITLEDAEKLVELSYSLCVFLKHGLPRFKAEINLCIDNMQNIVL